MDPDLRPCFIYRSIQVFSTPASIQVYTSLQFTHNNCVHEKGIAHIYGWKQKGAKWYCIKKQIEPFCIPILRMDSSWFYMC